jgi:hypothetical protein
MARRREGDGLKRTIVRRGDRFYAYEVTSHMENGRKVSDSKYIGRVDPVTEELLPRIPEKSKANREKIAKEKEIAILEGIDSGDYGAVHLLHELQLRTDLGLDLMRSFGQSGKLILAAAMALAMGNGQFDSIASTFRRTWLRRFYDLYTSVDSGTLSRLTEDIGGCVANTERFFELRMRGSKGLVAWDTTTNGCYSGMDGMAEYVKDNKDGEDIKQVKTGLATDMRGVPLMYRHYPGTISDMATVERMTDDIRRFGRDGALFVMDRGFLSGANVKSMSDGKIKFIVPATTSSKAVKSLLSMFKNTKDRKDMVHGGHVYSVWETSVGIAEADDRKGADGKQAYRFTLPGDDDHAADGSVTAFVCYDSEKFSDEMQNHKLLINDLKRKAEKIDAKDPEAEFRKTAGKAARYFDIEADGRKVAVTEKKNSLSFLENRAGLFVMLASEGVDWSVMMAAYDARRLTEQAFDCGKSGGKRFGTSDKTRMEGRTFIRFVELIMKCEMNAEIRESKCTSAVSAGGILSSLNTISARSYGSAKMLTEITKNCRNIYGMFSVEIPSEVIEATEVCDVMKL